MPALGLINDRGKLTLAEHKALEHAKWTDLAQKRFLAAYSECGSSINASRWAKISRDMHYRWLRNDPTYPARFREAEKQACQRLQDEAMRRAREGVRKMLMYKGEPVRVNGEIVYETQYSDTVLMFLLKGLNPDRFKERIQTEEKWSGDISDLNDEQLARLIEQFEALAARERERTAIDITPAAEVVLAIEAAKEEEPL